VQRTRAQQTAQGCPACQVLAGYTLSFLYAWDRSHGRRPPLRTSCTMQVRSGMRIRKMASRPTVEVKWEKHGSATYISLPEPPNLIISTCPLFASGYPCPLDKRWKWVGRLQGATEVDCASESSSSVTRGISKHEVDEVHWMSPEEGVFVRSSSRATRGRQAGATDVQSTAFSTGRPILVDSPPTKHGRTSRRKYTSDAAHHSVDERAAVSPAYARSSRSLLVDAADRRVSILSPSGRQI
jgi:hypothetical protein